MRKIYIFITTMLVASTMFAQTTCDLEALFMTSNTDPTPIESTITLEPNEDLSVYPGVKNHGPDDANTTVYVVFTTMGNTLQEETVDLNGILPANQTAPLLPSGIFVTAEDLNSVGLTGTFEVCMTVTYAGNDPEPENNTICITITREAAQQTTCDIEALFMTSNTDPTPIATTITLGPNEDLSAYPGVKNHGPDDANTTVYVVFTAMGNTVQEETVDLNGILPANQTAPLLPSGIFVTAEDLNSVGLTGTFEVCMTVTYAGNDPITDNNTICATIIRTTDIEENLVSKVSIYPNPANDFVTVANAENANIVIVNMIGEVVANVNNASANQNIDISKLANGTYFVKVDGEVFKINVVK